MSTVTNVLATGNQLTTNYDTTKFLLGSNSFIEADITAAGGNGVLLQGMVMGRIAATQLIVPLDKDATDGSQYPVGVCVQTQTVADGVTKTITLVNKGKIAESIVNFKDGALTTAIGVANHQRILRDWLNSIGLELMAGEELTGVDNQ
jgi:hypothetical protein